MNLSKKLLTACSLCFFALSMFAQPAQDHQHHGCHFAKNQIKMSPLTAAEKVLLNESNERSDTIDILNYAINLDITDFSGQSIDGNCEITFSPNMEEVNYISLDLLSLTVDSVKMNDNVLAYNYDGNFLNINFGQMLGISDTASFTVYYNGQPIVAASNFGGLAFQDGIAYNLGIGLGENPYNYGRGWFPCFDNFVERSTFDLNIISSNGRKAYCIGTFLGEEDLGDGDIIRRYRMSQPLTTYLVGVAVSTYTQIDYTHTGAYGDIPVQLIAKPGDMADMENSFEFLGDAIDALEAWYGPYAWERVGYVLTPRGAMEHSTSIAFPTASGINGPTFGANRLIAHELAHHWWGNVTTLSSPANMWIKEGNAEYGAHLFTEYAMGKEAFITQVKDNHQVVLNTAHVNDDGFQQLSGIPYEQTYGTHTYNKGASIIHNMRAYMGDTLFQQGQSAVLQDFAFQAVDAETYRDHLTASTGVDMTSYFEDWLFQPGHADYEIDNTVVTPNGNNFDVTVEIQQKGRAINYLHNNAPLNVTFYDADWNSQTEQFMVSGEFSTIQTTLPFEPVIQILNNQHQLNLAQIENTQVVTEMGGMDRKWTQITTLEATELTDSALVSIAHHWTNADDSDDPGVRMSDLHYWSVRGIFAGDFAMKATIAYSGSSANSFEFDLLQENDDSLTMMWRPAPNAEWVEYPHQQKLDFGSSGFFRLDPMLPGDYAYANAAFVVSTKEIIEETSVVIYPNPATDVVYLEGKIKEAGKLNLTLIDLTGKQILTKNVVVQGEYLKEDIDVKTLPVGIYYLQISNEVGELILTEKVTVN